MLGSEGWAARGVWCARCHPAGTARRHQQNLSGSERGGGSGSRAAAHRYTALPRVPAVPSGRRSLLELPLVLNFRGEEKPSSPVPCSYRAESPLSCTGLWWGLDEPCSKPSLSLQASIPSSWRGRTRLEPWGWLCRGTVGRKKDTAGAAAPQSCCCWGSPALPRLSGAVGRGGVPAPQLWSCLPSAAPAETPVPSPSLPVPPWRNPRPS